MPTTHELNIGWNYLSHWDVVKALRELIANALDEKQQVGANVVVGFDHSKGFGYIRDTGRGISQDAFIQQEIKSGNTIGNFGVGMKDAMTVLDREGIEVSLYSRDFVARLVFQRGTYKAVIRPIDRYFPGTFYVLRGVSPQEMKEAKSYFLPWRDEKVLCTNGHGQVLNGEGNIFFQGMWMGRDDKYVFSYNITALTTKMKELLGRDRPTNALTRSVYSQKVETILRNCNPDTLEPLVHENWKRFLRGEGARQGVRAMFNAPQRRAPKTFTPTPQERQNIAEANLVVENLGIDLPLLTIKIAETQDVIGNTLYVSRACVRDKKSLALLTLEESYKKGKGKKKIDSDVQELLEAHVEREM
jgi:hypothetical protein